jgi:hypothetical protein
MRPAKTKAPRQGKSPAKSVKQADDFLSVARRLECDEDKERFEKALGKIAKAKPANAR